MTADESKLDSIIDEYNAEPGSLIGYPQGPGLRRGYFFQGVQPETQRQAADTRLYGYCLPCQGLEKSTGRT